MIFVVALRRLSSPLQSCGFSRGRGRSICIYREPVNNGPVVRHLVVMKQVESMTDDMRKEVLFVCSRHLLMRIEEETEDCYFLLRLRVHQAPIDQEEARLETL